MRRRDFPIFTQRPGAKPLTYLDTAATAQKPDAVIRAMEHFLSHENAPVHRALYPIGERATARFEGVRAQVSAFLGGKDPGEIVFTRNATEGFNLVAQAWGRAHVRKGDEILVSIMEHHANFVPWLMLAKEKGAKLVVVNMTRDGLLDLRDLQGKLSSRTKAVALVHASNVLGIVNPIAEVAQLLERHTLHLRAKEAPLFVVDAAQSAPHMPIDVKRLGCDILSFSGHKLYGPTGVGVLWGRRELLEAMPPFLTGGQMIREVTLQHAIWNEVPQKFEAGSPDVAGVIGLGAAINYLSRIGWRRIVAHERKLMAEALRRFTAPQIRRYVSVYGPKRAARRSSVIAFMVAGVHPHDVATLLAEEGIAIRAGHHCAMPLHQRLGVAATARMSFGLYNDEEDLERFFAALTKRVLPLAIQETP